MGLLNFYLTYKDTLEDNLKNTLPSTIAIIKKLGTKWYLSHRVVVRIK